MSIDWYRKNFAPQQSPLATRPVPRFERAPEGGYYPTYGGQAPVPEAQYPTMDAPIGQIHLGDAVKVWKGTRSTIENSGQCPSCGSHAYAKSQGGNAQGRCLACNYHPPTAAGTMPPENYGSGIRSAQGGGVPTYQARSPRRDPLSGGAGGRGMAIIGRI